MPSKKKPSIPKPPVSGPHAAVEPSLHQQEAGVSKVTQAFGDVIPMPHGLPNKVVKASIAALNQALADTITLRDMYKKHHITVKWSVRRSISCT